MPEPDDGKQMAFVFAKPHANTPAFLPVDRDDVAIEIERP